MTAAMEHHELEARVFLSERWKFADLHPQYPATTETVIKLLTALEYSVDLDFIHHLVKEGVFILPPQVAGKRAWYATTIADLLIVLERMRRWLPFSPLHEAKKSRSQLQKELADAGAAPPVFRDLEKLTMTQLLYALAETDDRQVRELILTAIHIKAHAEEETIKDDHRQPHSCRN